jgi:hypothetical protein
MGSFLSVTFFSPILLTRQHPPPSRLRDSPKGQSKTQKFALWEFLSPQGHPSQVLSHQVPLPTPGLCPSSFCLNLELYSQGLFPVTSPPPYLDLTRLETPGFLTPKVRSFTLEETGTAPKGLGHWWLCPLPALVWTLALFNTFGGRGCKQACCLGPSLLLQGPPFSFCSPVPSPPRLLKSIALLLLG